VGGALAGMVWGDAYSGMQVGALLQLFALAGLPLGGRTPEDFASAGIVGASIALYLRHVMTTTSFAAPLVCGTVAGLITALVGRLLVRWLRARNVGLAHWLDAELAQGHAGAIDRAHVLGVFHAFAIGAGFVLASTVVLAASAHALVSADSLAVERACTLAEPALWGLGAGLAVRQLVAGGRHTRILFLAALVFWVAVRWLGR
jgi:mannose/fructose/N-acetylgalactosamine-specific phosphotransferase system component IIC